MNYYQPARYSYSCYSMLSFALSVLNIIYNYLYISKLYNNSEIERTPEINCHNCNCHKLSLTFTYSRFLYQATECQTKFVIHCEGIALDAEVTVGLQGAEVQAQRAVVASQRLAYHLTLSLSRRWRKKALVAAKKVATPAALMMTTVQKEAS